MSTFKTNKDLIWCADGICRYKGSEVLTDNSFRPLVKDYISKKEFSDLVERVNKVSDRVMVLVDRVDRLSDRSMQHAKSIDALQGKK